MKPIVMARDSSEAHQQLSASLFASLIEDTTRLGGKHLLTSCYRMVPGLLEFVSKAFYGGQVTCHDSVKSRYADLQKTLRQY